MADETISTRIVANADFSALIADVHKVTASLSRLQEQLANSNKMLANNVALMNRNFADTLRSTGQYSTHFVSLTSDVEKFGKNLDGGRLKLKDYFGTFQQHVKTSGGLIRELARQQVAMQNAILQPLGRNAQGLQQFNVHIPRGLDEIKNKTSIARQELAIMNRVIQDGAVQLINWGKNTQWAGRQLTVGLTLPLAAFGKASADAFRQADQELTRLTKVYGDIAGSTSAELGKVRQDVIATSKELSQAYGTNFNETISLAADIAATGKQGQELLASVKETSRLAVLGEVDRQEAMKATLAIQTAFQQNTDELSQSINFLNAVENQTSTSLADLVEAIPKAGPVVKQLGGDIQDLALYMTAMREGGINASEGANALKSGLAALINPTKQTVGVMSDFGIDILKMVKENAGDTTALLFDLQSALDNLDPLQKAQAIEQLFGKFQFARISALLNNLGRQGSQTLNVLDLMKASASDLEAVAGRELAAVTESASGRYKRAIESLRADLAGLGDQFLSIATTMIGVVDKALKFFEGLPKPIKQAITFLGALTALAGPLIMITGVLANFFGYILKGVMHMKAFFKGGEGWKYLTPEMLAAEKAGKLVEQSFYSDAKAASILQMALRNLIDEFSILEAKAKSGAMAVNPAVTTMAGNLVMGAGGGRVVNPSHPLAGAMGTRASTHMVPRAGLTEEQRMQQTIFGLVPGSIPVNRKIGDAPQIYMNQPLPPVPGLTQVGGVSTGVVAGEAARWHAMMATLAMQSKAEIETLKKQIATTGIVSKDFMNQFDDILPVVSSITDNAAQQSSLIVAELRAGKINVEQARAQIIALNLEIERMIGAAVTTQATAMGRTINPTIVPTLNQPVVDASGKSNMRELFKKSKTRDLIDKVSRSLGVRTSGAGYNIETTRPRKLAMGEVGVQRYAGGYTSIKAAQAAAKMLRAFSQRSRMIGGLRTPRRSTIGGAEAGAGVTFGQIYKRDSKIYSDPEVQAYGITPTSGDDYLIHGMVPGFLARTRGLGSQGSAPFASSKDWSYFNLQTTSKQSGLQLLPTQFIKNDKLFNNGLRSSLGADPSTFRPVQGSDMVSLLLFLKDQGVKPSAAKIIADRAANVLNEKVRSHKGPITEATFGKLLNNASVRAISSGFRPSMVRNINPFGYDAHSKNRGMSPAKYADGVTQLPGYGGGDIIPALLEPGESVITKSATTRNQGALALMNAGYPVDKMLGFQNGVVGALRSGFQAGKAAGPSQIGTGATSQMMGMGLLFGGQAVGGSIGQGMQVAGMLASFAPMLAPIGKMIKTMGSLTAVVTKFGSIAGRVFMAVRTGITAMLGPVGLAIAAVTALAAIIIKMRKDAAENKRDQESMFGLNKKSADELGIKYKNLTDRMKEVREEQKLMADQAKAKFEAYTSAGVTGLTLTIKQLRELKQRVKSDMPETLAILNNIDSSKVNDWASNLKAQMVASGKTVEEATNLIYALIEASNKAGQGVGAISSKAFTGIADKGSAANYIIENLSKNIDDLSKIDPSAFASNVDTAISSLDSAVQGLIGTKDATGDTIDAAEALAIQFENMANAKVKDKKLGEETLKTLKAQRPELAGILNQADTIGGMYAKWRLYIQGVNLDLSQLSSAQAETLATFMANLDKAGTTALEVGGGVAGLEEAAAALKKLKTAYEKANTAATADIDSKGLTKARIKAIQDEIKAIRDRAEAKKKALKDAFDAENTELEMQKLQLEYQQALARGDKDAAAQAQISIQQLSKQYQLQKAMDKIDENAKKAEAKQQGILDADVAYKNKLQDAANNAGDNANKLGKSIKTITDIGTALANVVKLKDIADAAGATDKQKEAFKIAFSNALNDIAVAAKSDPKVLEAYGQFLTKDAKGNYAKDAKGNYIPLPFNEASKTRIPLASGLGTLPEGGALTQLKELQTGMNQFALTLMGKDKKSLTDIYNILSKNNSSAAKEITTAQVTKALEKNQPKGSAYLTDPSSRLTKEGYLQEGVRTALLQDPTLNLEVDKIYNIEGYDYRVSKDWKGKKTLVRQAAMGGYIRNYGAGSPGGVFGPGTSTSDSIPAMLSNGEYVLNAAAVQNYGIPMLDKMNSAYNIPTNTMINPSGFSNNSYNNNVYNIDIDLNGTNVSADDIMRRFKAELALINAKEGRVRTVGGSY